MNDDLYELIAYLAQINRDEYEDSDLEEALYNQFDITMEQFENLIEKLLPLCCIAESPLTNKLYQGFGTNNIWLIKKEVK